MTGRPFDRPVVLATERLAKQLCEGAGIENWEKLAQRFQSVWLEHHRRGGKWNDRIPLVDSSAIQKKRIG